MNQFLTILAIVVAVPLAFGQASVSTNTTGINTTLLMTNGDLLTGRFLGIDPKEGYQLQHPAARVPFFVSSASVYKLTLRDVPSLTARRQMLQVKLINGDEIPIQSAELDAEKIHVETWFGGKLSIPRTAVRVLIPISSSKIIFEGPDTLKGWGAALMGVQLSVEGAEIGGVQVERIVEGGPAEKAGLMVGDIVTEFQGKKYEKRDDLIAAVKQFEPGHKATIKFKRADVIKEAEVVLDTVGWTLQQGALVANGKGGNIGRDVNLPDISEIEFELAWRDNPNLTVAFYCDRVNSSVQMNGYTMQISQNYVYLNRYDRDGDALQTSNIGNAQTQIGLPKLSSHISIRCNRNQKSIALLADGVLIRQWRDVREFPGAGKGIQFTGFTQPIKISQFRVREWNGRLPTDGEPASPNPKEDYIRLANEDSLSGSIISIREGRLNFKSSLGEFPVPFEKVGVIKFAASAATALPPLKAFITLHGGGKLNLTIDSWANGQVGVTSTYFGKGVLQAAAISSVEFR